MAGVGDAAGAETMSTSTITTTLIEIRTLAEVTGEIWAETVHRIQLQGAAIAITSVVVIELRRFPPGAEIAGSITRHTAAGLRIVIGRRQTGLVVRREVIRWLTGGQTRDSSWGGREVILRVIAEEEAPVSVIAPAEGWQIEEGRAERIELVAGIFPEVVGGTGMLSEVGPGDTTDPAHAPGAVVDLPAWDREVEASAEVAVVFGAEAVGGAGRRHANMVQG